MVARERGTRDGLVTAHAESEIGALADHVIAPATGRRSTGSTRLKAGSAQKLVLNGFSTRDETLAHLVEPHGRRRRDECQAARAGRPDPSGGHRAADDQVEAQRALAEAGGELKPALLNLLTGVPAAEARSLLDAHGGSVAAALGAIAPTR